LEKEELEEMKVIAAAVRATRSLASGGGESWVTDMEAEHVGLREYCQDTAVKLCEKESQQGFQAVTYF
jgi:hypothetical protein